MIPKSGISPIPQTYPGCARTGGRQTAACDAGGVNRPQRSQRRGASASEAGAATLEGDRIMQKRHTRALRVPKRWYPEIRGWAKLREKAPSGISGGIPPIPEGVGCQQMTPMGGS